MSKKNASSLSELRTPIEWNEIWGILNPEHKRGVDRYKNAYAQTALKNKLMLLFSHYGIQPSSEELWPQILPPERRRKTIGIAPIDPFFNLVVAMAFNSWPGFQIIDVIKKAGRPRGSRKHQVSDKDFLGIMMVNRARSKKRGGREPTDTEIIMNEIKDKKSDLHGMGAGAAWHRWKRIKGVFVKEFPELAYMLRRKGITAKN